MGWFFPRRLSERILFVYDANRLPVSFDVCWALAWAELKFRRIGHEKFDVVVVSPSASFRHAKPETHPDYVSREDLVWRIHQILLPLASMYRSVGAASVISAEAWNLVSPGLTRSARVISAPPLPQIYQDVLTDGGVPSGFAPPGGAVQDLKKHLPGLDGKGIVSITIRESRGGLPRNSRKEHWSRFAEKVRADGFFPVFVPDTERWFVNSELPALSLSSAAVNIGIRVALYDSAIVNMFVNSGPAAICYLSPDLPYLMFKILADGERLSSREVVTGLGFRIGENPPFAARNQKWVWEDDSLDVLYREFSAFVLSG